MIIKLNRIILKSQNKKWYIFKDKGYIKAYVFMLKMDSLLKMYHLFIFIILIFNQRYLKVISWYQNKPHLQVNFAFDF